MWPIFARFEQYELGTFGVFVGIAVLMGLWVARRLAVRDGLDPRRVNDIGLGTLIAAVIGAKTLGLLVALANGTDVGWSEVRNLGAIHGGILGALIGGSLLARHFRVEIPLLIDAYAPASALGQAVGRLGCFAAGCCFGSPSDSPWAVTFVHERAHALGGAPLQVALHPVQIYDATIHLAIFALLIFFHQRRLFVGTLLGPWFILEGCARLLMEHYRGDLGRGFWFDLSWLSTGRLTSLAMILFGSLLLFFVHRGRLTRNAR